MKFELLNSDGEPIANGIAELDANGNWIGSVTSSRVTEGLLEQFTLLAEAANEQRFHCVDRLDSSIAEERLRIRLEGGREMIAKWLFMDGINVCWKDNGRQEW